jgi:hypothetical protein
MGKGRDAAESPLVVVNCWILCMQNDLRQSPISAAARQGALVRTILDGADEHRGPRPALAARVRCSASC